MLFAVSSRRMNIYFLKLIIVYEMKYMFFAMVKVKKINKCHSENYNLFTKY